MLTQLTDRTTAGTDDLTACLLSPLSASGTGMVTEVLEIDPDFDDSGDLEAFLVQCGLDPEQVQDALAQLRIQAALGDPMVVRVTSGEDGTSWEISRVSAGTTPPLTAALA